MVRALATKHRIDAVLPATAEPAARSARASVGPTETARSLQQRLHDTYARAPEQHERELSAFAGLAIIAGASGLLWVAVVAAIQALV
ncbi:MAG TPA: hypothetical protein VF440_11910 [Novosphingobium sp.]